MIFGKVFAGESAQLYQAYGQGITQNQLGGGTGGGGQVVGAGFFFNIGVEDEIRLFAKEGIGAAGHPDQLVPSLFYKGREHFDFRGTAAFDIRMTVSFF